MYDLYYTVHILNILCGWASVSRFEIGLYVNGLNDFIQWWVCYSGVWMGKKNGNALSPNTEGVRRGTVRADREPKAPGRSVWLAGLGSSVSSLIGSGRHLVLFWSENAVSGKALKGLNAYLHKLSTYCAKSFSCQTDSSAKISFSLSLSHLAIGRSKFPHYWQSH